MLLGTALAVGLAGPATAEAEGAKEPSAAVTLPEPLTRDAIRELVARLGDAQVRELLLAQLDRTAVAGPPGRGGDMMGQMMGQMEGETVRLRDRLRAVLGTVGQLPALVSFAVARLTEDRGRGHLGLVVLVFAVMLAVAWGVEQLFWRLVGGTGRRLTEAEAAGAAAQAGRLLVRLVLEAIALAVFVATILAAFFALWQGHVPTRQLIMAALVATVLIRLAARGARFVLAPAEPAVRLLPFDDAAARQISGAVVRLAVIWSVGRMTVTLLRGLGAREDVLALLSLLVGSLVALAIVHAFWQSRAPIAALIRGGEGCGPARRALAEGWPILASAYVAVIFLAGVVEVLAGRQMITGRAGIGSIVLLVAAPLVDRALCWLLAASLGGRPAPSGEASTPASPSYEPVLRRGVHAVVSVVSLVVLARLWGVDLLSLAERGVGERFARALIDVAIVLLLADLVWQVARTAIDRRLALDAGAGTPAHVEVGGGGGPGSRLGTLLPLLRMCLFVAIVVMAGMLALSALGVNIGPLLAGAGIVGLAVGFGAQTLVRDIVSGMFFLLDDAFRVGEYVDTGQVKGTVEKISVRSMQIRHHRGALHTIPFGEISRLTNESRDWMIMKFEFRLAHDTDLQKVKKLVKQIGEELLADPELAPAFLQPLKSQGVIATDDTAITVGAKFMAKPGSQPYLIRREAYTRILRAFAANGIKFAQRQVAVYVPGEVTARSAVGAAAALAAEPASGESAPGR